MQVTKGGSVSYGISFRVPVGMDVIASHHPPLHRLRPRQSRQGAPGFVHGGSLATAIDDGVGTLSY